MPLLPGAATSLLAVLGLVWLPQADVTHPSPAAGSQPVRAFSTANPVGAAAHLSRQIAAELETGRIDDARIDAEMGVKRYPEDPTLRRRRAQVQFCRALQLEIRFGQAAVDARFGPALARAVQLLRDGPPPGPHDAENPELAERGREGWKRVGKKLLTLDGLAAVRRFQERVHAELAGSSALLQDRTRAL